MGYLFTFLNFYFADKASDEENEDASDTVPEDDPKPEVEQESRTDPTNTEQSTD